MLETLNTAAHAGLSLVFRMCSREPTSLTCTIPMLSPRTAVRDLLGTQAPSPDRPKAPGKLRAGTRREVWVPVPPSLLGSEDLQNVHLTLL